MKRRTRNQRLKLKVSTFHNNEGDVESNCCLSLGLVGISFPSFRNSNLLLKFTLIIDVIEVGALTNS